MVFKDSFVFIVIFILFSIYNSSSVRKINNDLTIYILYHNYDIFILLKYNHFRIEFYLLYFQTVFQLKLLNAIYVYILFLLNYPIAIKLISIIFIIYKYFDFNLAIFIDLVTHSYILKSLINL